MRKYKWNVRTVRISHDYIEEIVEADSQSHAEALIDVTGYDDDDDGWVVDENPDLFINEDYTERMDVLFPEDYANPDKDADIFDMSDYDKGYLTAKSHEYRDWALRHGGLEDTWHGITVAGVMYDINIHKPDTDKDDMCYAYKCKMVNGNVQTDTSASVRLW